MGQIAVLFAGQGAQYPKMGEAFYKENKTAGEWFRCFESIRPGTLDQCFGEDKAVLSQTINTQPCIFAVDFAIAEALKETGIPVSAAAGFSLGEIPALAFAGFLKAEDAFRLVCRRAQVMEEAGTRHPGGMQAVVKLDRTAVEELAGAYREVFPVNYNSPKQTAVAGNPEELKAFAKDVKEAGGRAIPLAVSGAFHSPYMNDAKDALEEYLKQTEILDGWCPVYANKTAEPYRKEDAKMLMAEQVNHPVQWVKTIETMVREGIRCFIEVGPGKTLSGLVAKIAEDAVVYHVETPEDLDEVVQKLK